MNSFDVVANTLFSLLLMVLFCFVGSCTHTSSIIETPISKVEKIQDPISTQKTTPTPNTTRQQHPYANRNPFLKKKYDQVVAYNFNLKEIKYFSAVNKNKKLVSNIVFPGRVLSLEEESNLFNILLKTSTYGGTTAACFDPRWAFVFYKSSQIVGCIDICMECNTLQSNPAIAIQKTHKEVSYYDGEKIEEPLFGFTPNGRKKLKKFCNQLDLIFCAEENTIFDN